LISRGQFPKKKSA